MGLEYKKCYETPNMCCLEKSPEWVNKLALEENVGQILVVAGVGDTTAYVSMHEKDAGGTFHQIMSTPGFIGKNGMGKTKEGDWKTPVGCFTFTHAFGIKADPGCMVKYHTVTEDDYWSGDVRTGYRYNFPVNIKELPDLDKAASEHLIDITHQYQYCLNISYNATGVPGLGSAIFLHCTGPSKPYSAGCVAIPKEQMITVMRYVKPDCRVIIDYASNMEGIDKYL